LVDLVQLEETLLHEGVIKFAEPHRGLISLIADRRAALRPASAGARQNTT
jgi:hypothetical protein